MGLIDRFAEVNWRDWDFRWAETGGNLKGSWEAARDFWKEQHAVGASLWNTAFGAGDAKDNADAFWASANVLDRAFSQVSRGGQAVGGVASALGDQPLFRQVFGTLDVAQREFVGRPIATVNLARADALNERNLGLLFDADTWKQAYNTTTFVTPGQAFVFATIGQAQDVTEMLGINPSAERRKAVLEQSPTVGIILQDPDKFDPRLRGEDGRQSYYENSLMKGVSGTLDVGIVLAGDPALAVSKLALLARSRFLSKEMTAAALQSGKLESVIDGRSYRKAKDFIRSADNSEQVRRRMFNNHYDGDLAAALLYDSARMQDDYASQGGVIDLYDTTFRALYGDAGAWDTLAQEAPRIADVIGHAQANYTLANAAKHYGEGNPKVNSQIEALMETKRRAWVDATVNGHGTWGQLGTSAKAGGLLSGTAPPRLTWTSLWRSGTYEYVRNITPVKLGHWARRSRHFLPSQRSGRMLDLNDPNSVGVFRSTLGLSRLDQREMDRWVGAYARATSPEARFAIYNAAENFAFHKHGSAYGLTMSDLDVLIPVMNRHRRGNRQILSANRRYASQDVLEEYERKLKANKIASATRIAAVKHQIDQAVQRGDVPSHYIELPDEFGNLTLIPEDLNIRLDRPVTITQHGDIVPMVDWNVLENALWWHVGFGRGRPKLKGDDTPTWTAQFGKQVYGAQDITRATLEAVMSTWKVTAILRPGYVPRTLSDELGRVWAKLGAFSSFATVGRGTKNTLHNIRSRRRLVGEIVAARRARGEGSVEVDAEAEVIAASAPSPRGARLSEDASFDPSNPVSLTDTGKAYRSYEVAFADGVIPLDDLVDRVEAHASAGTLNSQLAEIYGSLESGAMTPAEFRTAVGAYALRAADRGAYLSPAWQQSYLRHVVRAHERRSHGEPARISVVDPFSGESPDLTTDQIRQNITTQHQRLIVRADDGVFNSEDVRAFVEEHLDELLRPDSVLVSHMWPDGRIALAVGRNNTPEAAVKRSAGVRVRLPFSARKGDLIQDSGTAEITLNTAAGKVTIRGGFDGDHGDRLRKQVSNRGPDDAWVDAATDLKFAEFIAASRRYVDVAPDDWKTYQEAWSRAVMLQLAKDPAARQFLAGRSYSDVIKWLVSTSEGRAYQWRMGPWRSQFAEQVAMVQAMVDAYVPFAPARRPESFELRRKVLAGEATTADLERVVSRSEMPRVHGLSLEAATGRGPLMDKIKKATDDTFKRLSDMPNDKLVRFPFAAERYRMHAQTLAERRGGQLAGRGEHFRVDDLRAIEQVARRRALRDVQRYLYTTNATWDLAKALRLYVPFMSAIADSGLKWGVVLRENPTAALHIWKLWSLPDRAGLVTDENGNELVVEDGRETWYSAHPQTGERVELVDHKPADRFITFRLPSWLSQRYYGDDSRPQVRINKRVFRTFLDLPTAGPIITVPANKFALDNPEFAENEFVKQWILPLGPSADSSAAVIPTNVRNIRQVVFPEWAEQDRQIAEGQATAIFASDMTSYSLGLRPNPPTFEEARDKAASMRGLRFWAAFGAGISPQIQSPYQPYIDYYRQLRAREATLREQAAAEGRDQAEVPAADQLFYDEMGEEFFALTARVTRNALGIPATIKTQRAWQKYQDLIDRHPDVATLIIGQEGGGEFSRAVYEAQKLQELRPGSSEKQRGRLSPEESWEDSQKRLGWIEYGKFQDLIHIDLASRGLTSIEQTGAERIRAARDKWLQDRMFVESPWGETTLNPWFEDFRTIDTSRLTGRLQSFREIVQDRRLQGRDDIRGLIEYLRLRDRFRAFMDRQGWATLANDDAAMLRAQWQRIVFQLKEDSLAFSALHDRWLTGDETLAARG
jgi:hypothetical protein